jgi:TRAP-type C4-dicarboxylate transport system permease small subunit
VNGSWGNVLTTLEWPMAWQYMPMPLGMGLMMVFVGWDLVLILRGFPREQRYPAD